MELAETNSYPKESILEDFRISRFDLYPENIHRYLAEFRRNHDLVYMKNLLNLDSMKNNYFISYNYNPVAIKIIDKFIDSEIEEVFLRRYSVDKKYFFGFRSDSLYEIFDFEKGIAYKNLRHSYFLDICNMPNVVVLSITNRIKSADQKELKFINSIIVKQYKEIIFEIFQKVIYYGNENYLHCIFKFLEHVFCVMKENDVDVNFNNFFISLIQNYQNPFNDDQTIEFLVFDTFKMLLDIFGDSFNIDTETKKRVVLVDDYYRIL